jgi:hypothetical protein
MTSVRGGGILEEQKGIMREGGHLEQALISLKDFHLNLKHPLNISRIRSCLSTLIPRIPSNPSPYPKIIALGVIILNLSILEL